MELAPPREKIRQSNVELLRLVAMLLIVLGHVCAQSNFPIYRELSHFSWRAFGTENTVIAAQIGTNLFVLITAYFSVNATFKISALVKLWAITFFYSSSIFCIFIALNEINFSWRLVWQVIFPISYQQYWFISCYFCLYLLSPFVMFALKNMTKEQHLLFGILSLLLWSFLPSIMIWPTPVSGTFFNFLFWFITILICGAYIRLYIDVKTIRFYNAFAMLAASIALFTGYVLIIHYLNRNFSTGINIAYFTNKNNFFIALSSLAIFVIFLKINIKSKVINLLASCTIGIYLIHVNKFLFRRIFREYFDSLPHYWHDTTIEYVTWIIFVSVTVFAICLIIELIRRMLFSELSKRFTEFMRPYDHKVKEFLTNNLK